LKINNKNERGFDLSKITQQKRNAVKEKLKKFGSSSESAELVLRELEKYCQLIIQSIKTSNYG